MRLFDVFRPKPKWKHSDESVRFEAVKELTDQTLLATVAMDDTDHVATAAVAKISDQTLLAKIAVEATRTVVRESAIQKLTDQRLLCWIGKKDRDGSIRAQAIKRITDQKILADLAGNDPDKDVRVNAIRGLTDQGVVKELFDKFHRGHEGTFLMGEVIKRLEDQELLRRIWYGKKPYDSDVWKCGSIAMAIVEATRDQDLLWNATTWEQDFSLKAIEKLTDKEKLRSLAEQRRPILTGSGIKDLGDAAKERLRQLG